jgi:hypothetical protein
VHVTVALDGVEDADLLVNLADRLPEGLRASRAWPRSWMPTSSAGGSGANASRPIATQKLALETHQCRTATARFDARPRHG